MPAAAEPETPAPLEAWIGDAIARQAAAPVLGRRDDLIPQYSPGRSFVDVGAMWGVDGGMAFLAEESGAARVTAVDLTEPTEGYERRHAATDSAVRFVRGDLHDPATREAVGLHDVVWCTGVLYHVPHPLLTLEHLRSICSDVLILGSHTVPEVPGIGQASVFWPGLPEDERLVYTRDRPGRRLGLTDPFEPKQSYANWWWGITPSALDAMLAVTGFAVEERLQEEFHTTVVARLVRPDG